METKEHKHLILLWFTAVVCIWLFPAFAIAAVQLDAPTALIWGRDYSDDGSYTQMPGIISFVAGANNPGDYYIEVYKQQSVGDECVYSMDYYDTDHYVDTVHLLGNVDDLESGNYYFTVRALGDGDTYMDSGTAMSPLWHYVKPSARLPKIQPGGWRWPYADVSAYTGSNSWDSECQYYNIRWYYKRPYDGKLIEAGTTTVKKSKLADHAQIRTTIGSGYYYYTIRLISSNVEKKLSGEESALSAGYYYAGPILDDLRRILEGAVNDFRSGVQMLGKPYLTEALKVEAPDGPEVRQLMREMERELGSVEIAVEGGLGETLPEDMWDITGALLNPVTSDTVTLNIGAAKNENNIIPEGLDKEKVIAFSMELSGVEHPEDLAVPVAVTLPIPLTLDPDRLVILHYPEGGGEPEEIIRPDANNTIQTVSIVLEHLSDFVMAEENSGEETGEISYVLTDSYGDGWNNNVIRIVDTADGGEIRLSLEDGSQKEGTVSLRYGHTYQFIWVAGSYGDECSYCFTDESGNVILKTDSSHHGDGEILLTYEMKSALLPGDVNGDNTVDAKDLTTLARHVAKIETITDAALLQNADVDGVNGITAADLTKLARYVAKIISEL